MKRFILSYLLFIATLQAKSQLIDTSVNLGSYNLHFRIINGKGTPILFESGGGLDASQWDDVISDIYKRTGATLITYDRQGFGKSGIDTSSYNISNEIDGLESSLIKLGYGNKSIFLVCHSLGNFYSRVYCARHSNLVKGIVMLDPRIPSNEDVKYAVKTFERVKKSYNVDTLKGSDRTLYFVFRAMPSNESTVKGSLIPLSIPILDIMAEIGPYDNEIDNARFKSDQRVFVKRRSNCKLVYAAGGAHDLPKSKPRLVIQQIVRFYKLNQ